MREFADQVVFEEIVPLAVEKDGEASIEIDGLCERPLTIAPTSSVPAAVAGGATTEPQPRRNCSVVCGKPAKPTTPFNRTVSLEPLRIIAAMGIGKPAGHEAGAATFNV